MTAKKNGNDGRTRLKVKRVVFRVQYKRGDGWMVRGNARTASYSFKSSAVMDGVQQCTRLYRDQGIRTQLVIHGKDGRIQSERTYGDDPARRRG